MAFQNVSTKQRSDGKQYRIEPWSRLSNNSLQCHLSRVYKTVHKVPNGETTDDVDVSRIMLLLFNRVKLCFSF